MEHEGDGDTGYNWGTKNKPQGILFQVKGLEYLEIREQYRPSSLRHN